MIEVPEFAAGARRSARVDIAARWRCLPLTTEADRAAARAGIALATRGLVQNAMAFDIDWKAGAHSDWSNLVLMASDSGEYALLLRQDRPLPLYVGEKTWLRLPLIRFTTVGRITVGAGNDGGGDVAGLLNALASQLPRHAAIACEGIGLEDPVLLQIESDRRCLAHYLPLRMGAPYEHHAADLPDTFDAYLKGLSTRSRQSVLYSERKLEAAATVELACYSRLEQVDDFLRYGTAVSRLSYQWRLLGLGLRDDSETRASLQLAATRGWLRSYVLWVGGKPVAFMLGFQYGDTYDYTDVGFDPAWGAASVGTVLQLKVMRHLYTCADLPRPSCFDFSTGHGPHKARFGNRAREEINLLLLPRSLRGRLQRMAFLANEAVMGALTRTLDRFGLKERLKKLMRARAGGE